MPEIFTVTVSQINRRLAMMVKNDKALSDIYVAGEISNFTAHAASGHFYFTLKDETSSIKCVMFRSYAEQVKFFPESGMSVLIHGSVNVYERDGANQIYVTELIPKGIGDIFLSFQKAKAELEKDGYFNQKREIPSFPRKICVITSEKGAALQDILNIISRRCPLVKVIIIPVTVQGVTAASTMIKAIDMAQSTDSDVIIIGRGGGASEDLSAFNDISLAKALFNSKIPTISAVGHETDFTIADLVADMRAPTPSAAAELATGVTSDEILNAINLKLNVIKQLIENIIFDTEKKIDSNEKHIMALTPEKKIEASARELELLYQSVMHSVNSILQSKEASLDSKAQIISALNPMTILSRGYSVTEKSEKIVSSVEDINIGDKISITLYDGKLEATVDNKNKIKSGDKNEF